MCSLPPKPALWQTPFIEKLVDSIEIDEISISPSGDKVAYTVRYFGHERDKPISQLWLADVEVPGSGRKLTSDTHDHSIKWSPDGNMICFLSNKRDESYGNYGFQVSENRPESDSIKELYSKLYGKSDSTNVDPTQRSSKFYFSPDSKRIAFLAPDEKDLEEMTRDKAGDDVEVFGK
jgi:dipeptidyl aminopeptidase/acylaminoacyl peptidase